MHIEHYTLRSWKHCILSISSQPTSPHVSYDFSPNPWASGLPHILLPGLSRWSLKTIHDLILQWINWRCFKLLCETWIQHILRFCFVWPFVNQCMGKESWYTWIYSVSWQRSSKQNINNHIVKGVKSLNWRERNSYPKTLESRPLRRIDLNPRGL